MTTISVIIPTLGRVQLERAVRSVTSQLGPLDELIVVGDGPTERGRRIMANTFDPRTFYVETEATRSWGTHQYDVGSWRARGDWLMFLPDDDIMAPRAIEAVRAGVMGYHRNTLHLFACKMEHWGGRILANTTECGAVTANQIVIPNIRDEAGFPDPSRPQWSASRRQIFDWDFLMASLKYYGQEEPIFHDDVICIAVEQNLGQ